MLLVVSHLEAPLSGRFRSEVNYTAGGSDALSPNLYRSDTTNSN
jgi:hypothetical protein